MNLYVLSTEGRTQVSDSVKTKIMNCENFNILLSEKNNLLVLVHLDLPLFAELLVSGCIEDVLTVIAALYYVLIDPFSKSTALSRLAE